MAKEKATGLLPYIGIPIIGISYFIMSMNRTDAFRILIYELILMFGYAIAVSDIRTKKISNGLILAMLTAWVSVMIPKLTMDPDPAIVLLKDSVLGFLIGGGMFLFVYIVSKKGLGGGDVKFMAVAGLFLGLSGVFTTMFYGTCLAAAFGLLLIALKKIGRKDAIPLAPFLYVGIIVTVFRF